MAIRAQRHMLVCAESHDGSGDRMIEVVLDPGPIPYAAIELCGDMDLEQALRHDGREPGTTQYRLIEIPLDAIVETASMERWTHFGTTLAKALEAGLTVPPVVVTRRQNGFWLLDGVNRTYAHWKLRRPTIRAYELLV